MVAARFQLSSAISIVAAGLLLTANVAVAASGDCSFPPRKPLTLKSMGPCQFDLGTLSFKGDPAEQAACLTTPVLKFGELAKERAELPPSFAKRVGRAVELPKRDELRTYLLALGLGKELADGLGRPIAHANDGDPIARSATYFVIHDTSAPNFMLRPFPDDINTDRGINNLGRYYCANHIERAHIFINRMGVILLGHDYEVPWRATKFETATDFQQALKGLFVHHELIQPRRGVPGRGWMNDFEAPIPGYSQAQYNRLALVYAVASLRAGFWLIPAFHAVIDEGIYDKHDDPQNFEFAKFASAIDELLKDLPLYAESVRNYVP